jgi:hypothetical protein
MKRQSADSFAAKRIQAGFARAICERTCLSLLIILIPLVAAPNATAAAPKAILGSRECRNVVLTGEVAEGQSWETAIGEGWIFRVLPIYSPGRNLSGWDLVVDRAQGGGYPDALLLGTPPYGSLNQREIGTTFGLRAQDAIAWEPRRFHFLISERDLQRGRELFRTVTAGGKADEAARSAGTAELLKMVGDPSRVAAGEFEVLETRLTAGVADPPVFARQWAAHFSRVPHTLIPATGPATAQGELRWIRFRAMLWVPERWRTPKEIKGEQAKCAE